MNKILLFITIFVSSCLFSQNDITKISYKISINKKNFEKNDTIVSENNKEILNHFKSILKNAIEKKYDLLYKDSISLFIEKVELDNNTVNSNLYNKSSNDKLYININKKHL
ncbi:MAG: hypothetical protein HC854_02065 [Flavobacterium sp.]|nr:hypothetical protein [Flavobacterium sp.]